MSYVLYDSRGYLADGPSIQGLEDLYEWAPDDVKSFIEEGHTTDLDSLIAALDEVSTDGDVESSRVSLLKSARAAKDVLILNDGVMDEPRTAASRETSIHESADSHAPAIKKLFTTAFKHAATKIPRSALKRSSSPTVVTKLLEPAIQAIGDSLEPALERALLACLADGGQAALDMLTMRGAEDNAGRWAASKLSVSIKFNAKSEAATKWARKHAAELVTDITKTTRDLIRDEVVSAFKEGTTPAQLADLLEQIIDDDDRAELIARNETMIAASNGQRQAWDQAIDKGLLTGKEKREWITTGDQALCFVAGTQVKTPDGQQNIENIQIGDFVDTHLGPQRVTALSVRETNENLVYIKSKFGNSISTDNHPFLILRNGCPQWVRADSLKLSDFICVQKSISDSLSSSEGFYLRLCDSDDLPSLTYEKQGLSFISCLVFMPIVSVYLQSDFKLIENKINTVSSDFSFLDKQYINFCKLFSNHKFKRCFTYMSSITGFRAKSSINCDTRLNSESFTTNNASNYTDRSSAQFGTMLSCGPFGNFNLFPAFNTIRSLTRSKTLDTSNIAMLYSSINSKLIAAINEFFNNSTFFTRDIAISRTKQTSSSINTSSWLKRNFTLFANKFLGMFSRSSMITRSRTKSTATINTQDVLATMITFSHNYNKVYSLSVEKARTFFAGNMLVHNCDECEALDGKTTRLNGEYPDPGGDGPPLHVSCRCSEGIVYD